MKTHCKQKNMNNGTFENTMDFELFKLWLDTYPFVLMIFRESMMPNLWSLKGSEKTKMNVEIGQ